MRMGYFGCLLLIIAGTATGIKDIDIVFFGVPGKGCGSHLFQEKLLERYAPEDLSKKLSELARKEPQKLARYNLGALLEKYANLKFHEFYLANDGFSELLGGKCDDITSLENIRTWKPLATVDSIIKEYLSGHSNKSWMLGGSAQSALLAYWWILAFSDSVKNPPLNFFSFNGMLGGISGYPVIEKSDNPLEMAAIESNKKLQEEILGKTCYSPTVGSWLSGFASYFTDLRTLAPSTIMVEPYRSAYAFSHYFYPPLEEALFKKTSLLATFNGYATTTEQTKTFKENLDAIKRFDLFASSSNKVIQPWQSSFFGTYPSGSYEDSKLPMTFKETELYKKNILGWRNRAEAGQIFTHITDSEHRCHQDERMASECAKIICETRPQ